MNLHRIYVSVLVLSFAPVCSAQAGLINTYPTTIGVTVSDDIPIGLGVDMVSGAGFFGSPPNFTDSDLDTVPEHDNSTPIANDMWIDFSGPVGDAWAAFDLGQSFELETMRVWNYNQSGATARGVATANIWYSNAASPGLPVGDATNPAISGWTQLGAGAHSFTVASGLVTYDDVDDFSFGGVNARHVLIDIVTAQGGGEVGLSEVQFFAAEQVPEPSSLVLLTLGALAVVRRSRKRKSRA